LLGSYQSRGMRRCHHYNTYSVKVLREVKDKCACRRLLRVSLHAGATRKGQPVQLPLAEHNALSVNRAALAPAILPAAGLPPPTEQAAFLAGPITLVLPVVAAPSHPATPQRPTPKRWPPSDPPAAWCTLSLRQEQLLWCPCRGCSQSLPINMGQRCRSSLAGRGPVGDSGLLAPLDRSS
jgi:hypothetical protein